jgi:hypothetical protein
MQRHNNLNWSLGAAATAATAGLRLQGSTRLHPHLRHAPLDADSAINHRRSMALLHYCLSHLRSGKSERPYITRYVKEGLITIDYRYLDRLYQTP